MARPKPTETPKEHRDRMTRYTNAYRLRHPDRIKKTRKNLYTSRKKRAMEMVGGALCKRCGCTELDFLEFNHIGGNGCKEWRANGRIAPMDLLLSGKRKPEGLEILCRLCNALDFLERKNPQAARGFTIKWKKV